MTRLVTQLLDLARKQSMHVGAAEERRPVDLSRVAREAAGIILPMAETAGRSLVVSVPDRMLVLGAADDLRDMLCNLLENAIIHGTGTVRLSGRVGALHTIMVTDEGAGIAEPLREAVFERFRKASPASPGTGLGLSIVREVARSHGGRAFFHPGPASIVEIQLPRCAAEGALPG